MSQNKYINTVESARRAARECLRARRTSDLMSERRVHTEELEQIEKEQKSSEKRLAIAAFEVERARATNDPRLEDIQKAFEGAEKSVATTKENLECSRQERNRQIRDIEEHLSEVASGKTKMSFTEIESLANDFLKVQYRESFVNGDYNSPDNDK